MRWNLTLREIRAKKLELARIDPRAGMPVAPPPGVTGRTIEDLARRLGGTLPPSYRAFLELYDGWHDLYQGVSLLGAKSLARGTYVDLARVVIDQGDAVPKGSRRRPALVPFGIDPAAETIFAWDTTSARADGELEVVVWMNEIGERVESFPALLDLVLDMLTADVDERRRVTEPRARRPKSAGAAEPWAAAHPAGSPTALSIFQIA